MRHRSFAADERVNWPRSVPFVLMHVVPLGALFTGVRLADVLLCVALYYVRMFFITAGYHRYFAHRSYRLGRGMQLLMALGGATAAQKGPLWWAAHHRHHHRYSDAPQDVHSPLRGFWWSHVGWILCDRYQETRLELVRDLAKVPELRWVNRYWLLPPTLLAAAIFFLGGASALFIGFFLSTVLLYHGTFLVNSVAHVFGRRRYVTTDTSRNSMLVALLTCGEGWHNNHHYFQSTARQGFFWWEVDLSYYVLKALSFVRLAHGLRVPSAHVLGRNRIRDGHFDVGMFNAYWERAVATLSEAQRHAGDYYEAKVRALAGAQRQAGEYYDEKRKALEDFASQTVQEAQRHAAEFYDLRRRRVDDLVHNTRQKAADLGIVPKDPADVRA
jgi:stearoyl-CoA desaturase (Delta-9 desaturase)